MGHLIDLGEPRWGNGAQVCLHVNPEVIQMFFLGVSVFCGQFFCFFLPPHVKSTCAFAVFDLLPKEEFVMRRKRLEP